MRNCCSLCCQTRNPLNFGFHHSPRNRTLPTKWRKIGENLSVELRKFSFVRTVAEEVWIELKDRVEWIEGFHANARSIPGACLARTSAPSLSKQSCRRARTRKRDDLEVGSISSRLNPGNVTFQQVVEFLAKAIGIEFPKRFQTATPISLCGWCSINSPIWMQQTKRKRERERERERDYPSWNESSTEGRLGQIFERSYVGLIYWISIACISRYRGFYSSEEAMLSKFCVSRGSSWGYVRFP